VDPTAQKGAKKKKNQYFEEASWKTEDSATWVELQTEQL